MRLKPLSLSPGHGTIKAAGTYIYTSMFATMFDTQSVNLALPHIQEDLNISKSTA